MTRKKAHFENKEPFLEGLLSTLRFRKILKHIPENSSVLDLGCGYNANLLRKVNGRNCKGLDMSVNKKHDIPNTELVEHDLNKRLPFEDNTFTVVTSLANLEHLNNPVFSLGEIYRVLKPGGILLLTTPSLYAKPVLEFLAYKLRIVSEEEIRDHKNYFNKSILLRMSANAGFKDTRHTYFQLYMNNFIKAVK